jgi:hypothetical protein
MSAKVDHTLKLVHITSKGITTSVSYEGYKFNPAEFNNFSYDFGGEKIIQIV